MSDKVDVTGKITLQDNASPTVRKIQQNIAKIGDSARKMGASFKRFGNMGLMGGLTQTAHNAGTAMAALGRKVASVGASLGALIGIAGFGGVAVEMQKYIDSTDALAKASVATGTSIEQLQDLRYAAGMAGLSAEELESGMVKLNKALGDAGRGSNKELASMFKRLGISLFDANKQARPAGDVMNQLANAVMNNKNQIARNDIVMQAFGKTGAKWIAMLEGGQISLQEMSEAMRQHGRISDEMAKRAERQQDAQFDVQMAFAGITNVLYDKMLPGLTRLTEATSKWLNENKAWIIDDITAAVRQFADAMAKLPWAEIGKGLKDFGSALKAGFDAIGGWNTVLPALAVVLGGTLLAGLYAVTAAIISLNVAMLSNPFVLGAAAIGAAAYLIYSNWEPIAGFFTDLWNTVGNAFKTVDGWIQSFIQDFEPSHLMDLWNALPAYFKGLWADIQGLFPDGSGVGSWMGDIGAALLAPLSQVGSNLADGFGQMWDNAKQPFNDFLSWLGGGFTSLMQGAGNLLVGAWDWVAGGFSAIWAGIRYPFDVALGWVTDFVALFAPNALLDAWRALDFSGVWNTIKAPFDAALGWLSAFVSGFSGSQLISVWESVSAVLSSIWNGPRVAFEGAVAWLADFIGSFSPGGLLGVWEGVAGAFSTIWNAPRAAFDAALTWLEGFVSRFVPGGLLAVWQALPTGFTAAWEMIKAPFVAAGTWLDGFVSRFVPGGLLAVWQALPTGFTAAWEMIKAPFVAAGTWLDGFVSRFVPGGLLGVWEALAAGFTAAWEMIKAPFIAAATWLDGFIGQFVPGGLLGVWQTVASGFTTVWQTIKAPFDAALGWVQTFVGQFLPGAILDAWRALDFAAIWGTIKGSFDNAVTWLGEFVTRFIPQPLLDAWNKVAGFFTQLWADIMGVFERAWAFIEPIIAKLMAAIGPLIAAVRGVANAAGAIGDKVKGAGGAVVEGVKNTAGAVADTGKKLVSGVREYLPSWAGGAPGAAPAAISPVAMAPPSNPVQDAMRANPPVAEIDGEVKTTVDIKLPPGVTATTTTESTGRVKPRTNVGTSMAPA